MNKIRISSLREGDEIEGVFVVKIKKTIQPYSRGYRFDLVLGDETGKTLECTYWGGKRDEVERLHKTIEEDSVIKVKGKVDSYKKQLHLSVGENGYLERLKSEERRFLFVREPKKDIEIMKRELMDYIKSVKDNDFKKLLEDIFSGEFLERFADHAGAIQYHHAWRGGLLQHTLEVAEIGDLLARQHKLNRDLVITGALLHDIGKVEEIEVNVRIKGTLQGSLLGHIVQSIIMVDRACSRLALPRP
ncbi:MAG: HD domain-containing protein, partial [Candidatus Asgardarchaeia archaeon]